MRIFITLLFLSLSSFSSAQIWVNQSSEFQYFLKTTKASDFAEAEALYAELFEAKNPMFYAEGVYYKGLIDDWQAYRRKTLEQRFKQYREHSPEAFLAAYSTFDQAAHQGITEFREHFSNYTPNFQVNLVPGITWGGSIVPTSDGKKFLTLGVDLLVLNPELLKDTDLPFLVVHEVSHAYHSDQHGQKINYRRLKEEFTLANRMWQEGMANWISWQVRPDHDLGLQMSGRKLDRCALGELAPKFQEISHLLAFADGRKFTQDWFSPSPTMQLSNGTTVEPMVGYMLGALAIDELIKAGNTPDELLSLSYDDIAKPLARGLTIVATKYNCD